MWDLNYVPAPGNRSVRGGCSGLCGLSSARYAATTAFGNLTSLRGRGFRRSRRPSRWARRHAPCSTAYRHRLGTPVDAAVNTMNELFVLSVSRS